MIYAQVETRLRSINKFAPIVRSTKSEVSPDQVLGIGAFDLKRTLEMDPEFLDTEGEHEHDNTVSSIGINLCGNQILRRVRRVYLHAIDATPARWRGARNTLVDSTQASTSRATWT